MYKLELFENVTKNLENDSLNYSEKVLTRTYENATETLYSLIELDDNNLAPKFKHDKEHYFMLEYVALAVCGIETRTDVSVEPELMENIELIELTEKDLLLDNALGSDPTTSYNELDSYLEPVIDNDQLANFIIQELNNSAELGIKISFSKKCNKVA